LSLRFERAGEPLGARASKPVTAVRRAWKFGHHCHPNTALPFLQEQMTSERLSLMRCQGGSSLSRRMSLNKCREMAMTT
jgi:hypothetical protein